MTKGGKVVWSEGMFLRTQHFQQQDRHTEALVRRVIHSLPHTAFGFEELSIDESSLEAGLFGIEGAKGLFPDGTSFLVSGGASTLEPVKVANAYATGLVHLALTAEQEGAAAIDPAHAHPSGARLRGEMTSVRDEVQGGADPEEIEIAQPAPKLLLPGQDTTGYVTLPVARLNGLDASGGVQLDNGFLPPALTMSAIPFYARFVQEIINGLERIADTRAGVVIGGTGASVEDLIVLELANVALPKMKHLLSQNQMHPSDLYMEISALAGQMATFGSSSRRMGELEAYHHTNPQPAFSGLADTVRSLILSLRHVEEKARALRVARHSENIWTVQIDNPDIIRSSRIVLRIGGQMSEKMMRTLFVDQATVGAADEFDTLWKSRLTGIPLKPLHSQPREIPYDGDRLCLELDRQSDHWSELSDAPGFVIGVSGKLEREPEIDCYAINR